MKSKKIYTTALAFVGIVMGARSQMISPFIINSAGGSRTIGDNTYEYSIGELAVIETYITPNFIVTNGVLQPFTQSVQGPLPVTLISFRGIKMTNYNKLDWTTSFESDNSQFELQRSDNAISFTTVYSIPARNLAGGSSYTYNDYAPFGPVVYYRLGTKERDGTIKYSPVISLRNSAAGSNWSVYPNPVKLGNRLQVSVYNASEPKRINLTLTDVAGRIVYQDRKTIEQGSQTISLPVPAASGTYILQVTGVDNNETRKIVVY